eukprot:TRINITY_DN1873_c0_g1_i1.p1 TRINITY_DN1873_c0_g1~~TRINITY_DN1873_c0_g1_i1.p1  ORF type:complete len:449 (-),score=78.32 TRINITY_DN1873_c0_g1_i1:24-1370(-)
MDNEYFLSSGVVSSSKLALVNILGGWIFGYNTGVVSPGLDLVTLEYGITGSLGKTFITMSMLIGAAFGSLFGGALCNKFGRKIVMALGCVIVTVGVLCSCFSPTYWVFLLARGLMGIGVGFVGVVCPMYVSETADKDRAGFLGTLFQLSITVGIVLAYLMGYIFCFVFPEQANIPQQSLAWRIMFGAGVIPSISLAIIAIVVLPESTHWLRSAGGESKPLTDHSIDPIKPKGKGILGLFSYPKQLILGIMLAACLQLTGINVIMYYGPEVLKDAFSQEREYVQLLNVGVGAWNAFATLIAIGLVDKAGRRPLMLLGSLGVAVASICVGLAFFLSSEMDESPGWKTPVVAASLALYLLGFETGPGCLFWVLVNEIFPDEVSDAGSTFVNALQWVFNIMATSTFLVFQENIGAAGTFWIYGGVGIVVTLYLFFSLTETKQSSNSMYDDIN